MRTYLDGGSRPGGTWPQCTRRPLVGAVALVPGVVVASPWRPCWRRVGVKGERHIVRVGMPVAAM